MEVWYLVAVGFLAIPYKADELREVSALIKCLDFCLVPLALVITSSPIRAFARKTYLNFTAKVANFKNN